MLDIEIIDLILEGKMSSIARVEPFSQVCALRVMIEEVDGQERLYMVWKKSAIPIELGKPSGIKLSVHYFQMQNILFWLQLRLVCHGWEFRELIVIPFTFVGT